MISRSKKYRYTDGSIATILTVDRDDIHTPVVSRDEKWNVSYHGINGTCVTVLTGLTIEQRDLVTVRYELAESDAAKFTRLMGTPSTLVRQALDALDVIEENPEYEVCMEIGGGHLIFEDETVCTVSLGGSWLAVHADLPIDIAVDEGDDLPYPLYDILSALDNFSSGYIAVGLDDLDIAFHETDLPAETHIIEYINSRSDYKQYMHQLADSLESAGL